MLILIIYVYCIHVNIYIYIVYALFVNHHLRKNGGSFKLDDDKPLLQKRWLVNQPKKWSLDFKGIFIDILYYI